MTSIKQPAPNQPIPTNLMSNQILYQAYIKTKKQPL